MEELAKISKKKNLIIAITDHNNMDAIKEAKKLKINFIPGEEITTLLNGKKADLIAYFIKEPIPYKTDYYEAIDLIKSQDGVSYVPHPLDVIRHGINDFEAMKKADIIEVLNSKSNDLKNKWKKLEEFAIKNKKLIGAGSDAHLPENIGDAYMEGNFEKNKIENAKDLKKFLKNANPIIIKERSFFEFIKQNILKLKKKIENNK